MGLYMLLGIVFLFLVLREIEEGPRPEPAALLKLRRPRKR